LTPTDSDTGPQSSISLTHSTLDGKPVVRPARNVPALVAGAGALVASIAFFLPWAYSTPISSAPEGAVPIGGSYISGWQQSTQFFTTSGLSATDAITLFFLTAMPLIMAALVLLVSLGDLSRRLDPFAWIVALTGGIFGTMALFFSNLYSYVLAGEPGVTGLVTDHAGFGIIPAFIGYVALMVGCIGALMQRSPARAG
jgi:hypothetical protein